MRTWLFLRGTSASTTNSIFVRRPYGCAWRKDSPPKTHSGTRLRTRNIVCSTGFSSSPLPTHGRIRRESRNWNKAWLHLRNRDGDPARLLASRERFRRHSSSSPSHRLKLEPAETGRRETQRGPEKIRLLRKGSGTSGRFSGSENRESTSNKTLVGSINLAYVRIPNALASTFVPGAAKLTCPSIRAFA